MEAVIFSSFLTKKKDKGNQVFLTNDKLVVIFKGKMQAFYRSNILKLAVNKKKLIIPLVIGGIGTSLSMIATSMGWYDRQLNLFITLLFFGILYYGFVGKDAFELFEKGNTNIYLLDHNLEPILRFINFYNSTKAIDLVHTKQKIYHIATRESWEDQLYESAYTHDSLDHEGFIHASTLEHLIDTYNLYYQQGAEVIILTIIPELLIPELKFELAESRGVYFPHIFGAINKTAVQSVMSISSEEELMNLIHH